MTYENGLFLFHRDLRLQDNVGLAEATRSCKQLFLCFIFTPEQISFRNKFRSNNSIQFMMESLDDLAKQVGNAGGNLMTFYGKQTEVLNELVRELKIDYLVYNKDYSPYAVARDGLTRELCKKMNVQCSEYEDYYLYPPGSVLTGSGTAYKKYTPFYNTVVKQPVQGLSRPLIKHIGNGKSANKYVASIGVLRKRFIKKNDDVLVHGGRNNGLLKLLNASKKQKEYDTTRDFFEKKTTHLSAYIKFGCVSIREVYHKVKKTFGVGHGIIRELIWREFFAHVLYCYPEVVGKSFQPRYRHIQWQNNETYTKLWKTGETGFPLVDACMREMNTTGYMHNRGRMLVASVLIKVLLVDWRIGERYFAQQLTDYDIASNNGNWQGISGTGVDMKPYFRDMNPWIQSSKFDSKAEYIRKWVPELKDVLDRDIHNWYDSHSKPEYAKIKYPEPIVDYPTQKAKMMTMYEKTKYK